MSDIEWTDRTWNPIVGCTRVSPGCEHCYAERFVHRGLSPQHRGLTVLGKGEKGPRWTGEVRVVESRLAEPLSWKKPTRVFVNSLSDLWHEGVSNETVVAIFGVMAACPHLTFQILTKRPARMHAMLIDPAFWTEWRTQLRCGPSTELTAPERDNVIARGFLRNVWLGVTAEDQQRADERIPVLLDTPAAVRFVSYEPALGPVDFKRWVPVPERFTDRSILDDGLRCSRCGCAPHEGVACPPGFGPSLDWIIIGGESGPKARPFDLAWARSAVEQCKAAGVPVFAKQLGAKPFDSAMGTMKLAHRKGSDMGEWEEQLRVREFPR